MQKRCYTIVQLQYITIRSSLTYLRLVERRVCCPLVHIFIDVSIIAAENASKDSVVKVKCVDKSHSVWTQFFEQRQYTIVYNFQLLSSQVVIL